MNKQTGIILGALCILVVALVGVTIYADSKTASIPYDTLLTVGGTTYTVNDYKTYVKLKNYSDGEPDKVVSGDEINEMLDAFLLEKMYYSAAKKKNVSGDDSTDYAEEYESKKDELVPLGISKEDYVSYKEENSLVNSFKNHFGDYYSVPQDTYDSVVNEYKEQDMYKTYSFRIIQIPYELPKSGDEAETNETPDVQTETESGEEKKDMSKEAQRAVAEDVLLRIRSGDDFEELAKEYGTMRFTFVGTGYTIVNGTIEYATSPVLQSKLGGEEDIYKAFLDLKPGECTEIFDEETYTSFEIVKLETIDEGFVGEGEKELKALLLNEIMDSLVSKDVNYEFNQGAVYQIL